MKRFAVRSLAFALALAGGTVAAQDYYDDRSPVYDDGYAARDDRYYGDDAGYYGQEDAYASQSGGYYGQQAGYVAQPNGYYGQVPSAYPDPRVAVRAGYGYGGQPAPAYDMARVLSVDPIVEPSQPVARQQCWSEPSPSYAYRGGAYPNAYRDPYAPRAQTSGGGALIGAIAGGVLGNSVGDGDGRKAATVIGAVLGGTIGNNIERNGSYRNQAAGYPQPQVQRCRTVTSQVRDERVLGYRVGYEYAGRRYETMTDYHPGSEIRVRVDVSPAG
jgi:uncharacterized protein YcfJ